MDYLLSMRLSSLSLASFTRRIPSIVPTMPVEAITAPSEAVPSINMIAPVILIMANDALETRAVLKV